MSVLGLRVTAALLLAAVVASGAGCNTVQGFGEDLQVLGETMAGEEAGEADGEKPQQ